jgi:uncharacterized protein
MFKVESYPAEYQQFIEKNPACAAWTVRDPWQEAFDLAESCPEQWTKVQAEWEPWLDALTRAWVDEAVVGLNLCPFAKAVVVKRQMHVAFSWAFDPEGLLADLARELQALATLEPEDRDTTVLVCPVTFSDFFAFNDFLEIAEAAVEGLGLSGVLQVASFHPQYQFADAKPDDLSHATNQSPYPVLHLIRESSLDRAVEAIPDPETIWHANVKCMRSMGLAGWEKLQAKIIQRASDFLKTE